MRRGCCCGGNECYANAYISLVVSQQAETSFECENFTPNEVWLEDAERNLETDEVYGADRFFPSGNPDPDAPYDYGYPSQPARGLNNGLDNQSEVFFTLFGESNYPFVQRWHRDETEEYGNLFCMLDEDVFHPKVSASKYGITPEMRADDVSGGQIDAQGKVRVGLELALHYKYYDPTEGFDWTQEIFYDNYRYVTFPEGEDGQPIYTEGTIKQEYPACVDNPAQYIETDAFIPHYIDPETGGKVYTRFFGNGSDIGPPLVRLRPRENDEWGFEDVNSMYPGFPATEIPCYFRIGLEGGPYGSQGFEVSTNRANYNGRYYWQGYNNGADDGHVFCSDWFIRNKNNVPPSCSASRCVTSEELCEWMNSPEAKMSPQYGFDRRDFDGFNARMAAEFFGPFEPLNYPVLDGGRNLFNCQCDPDDAVSPNIVSSRCCGSQKYSPAVPDGYSTEDWVYNSQYTWEYGNSGYYYFRDAGDNGYNFFGGSDYTSWHNLITYTCPPKPPTCLGAEKPGLPGLEYVFKEVSPREGDTKGELNGTSEIVEYTYNKIIQRFGPTILPNGEVNPLPNNIVIQITGGPSFSIDEIGITQPGGLNRGRNLEGKYVDFAEGLFQKYVDEHGIDVAIQRFSTCGVNHPQEYGGDGCIGFDCLEPTIENHGEKYMGYRPARYVQPQGGQGDYEVEWGARYYTPCYYYHTEYPFDDEYPHPLGISDPLGLRSTTKPDPVFFYDSFPGGYYDDPDGFPVYYSNIYLYDDQRFMKRTFRSGRGLGALFYTPEYDQFSYNAGEGYVQRLFGSLEHWLCPNCSYNGKNEFIDREKVKKYFPEVEDDDIDGALRTFYTLGRYRVHPDSSVNNVDSYPFNDSLLYGPYPKIILGGPTGEYFYPGRVMGEHECYMRDYYGDTWTEHEKDRQDYICEQFGGGFGACDNDYYYKTPDEGAIPNNGTFPRGGFVDNFHW